MIPILKHFLPMATLAALMVACGKEESGDSPLVESEPSPYQAFNLVDSVERFRYQRSSPQTSDTPSNTSAPKLVYDTPEDWTEKPGSMMRDINFSFGENGEGECYVARLPGAGGGLTANVNRWRGQMGAEPLSEEQVAGLPKKDLFGEPATFISVDGEFSPGMGSSETFPDYRLVGLIHATDAGAVFVKMTGPRELVESNMAAFDQFLSSMRITE